MGAFTVDPVTNLLTSAGHALAANAPVVVSTTGTLPTPLRVENVMYARDVDANTLKLAYYPGGPEIDVTDVGAGVHTITAAVWLSALDQLVIDMRAYFSARSRTEVIAWGRRALTKQTNQQAGTARAGRVVVVPGDDTGKLGKLLPAKDPGHNPRCIYTFAEMGEVHVWGHDPAAPDDELAHYRIAWALFERVLRAIRSSQCGRIELSDPKITVTPVERVFGCELVFLVTVAARVLDEPATVVRATDTAWTASHVGPSGDTPVSVNP